MKTEKKEERRENYVRTGGERWKRKRRENKKVRERKGMKSRMSRGRGEKERLQRIKTSGKRKI